MQTKPVLALIALGVMFGSAFLFMKVIVDDIAATELVAGRVLLGAVTVLTLMTVLGKRPTITLRFLAGAAALGVLDSIIPYTLIAWAEIRIDSGVAAVLISTMPIFTVAIAAVALPEERLTSRGFVGLGTGFLGVVILTGGDIFDITNRSTVGMLAVIGAAASYGSSAVLARKLLKTNGALELTGVKLSIGTLMAFALTFAISGVPNYGALSLEGTGALIALGVVSIGFAFAGFAWLVSSTSSVFGSLVTYIVPVAGLGLGWIVLGESIGLDTLLGAAMIAAGVAGVMHRPKQTPVQDPAPVPQPVLVSKGEYA